MPAFKRAPTRLAFFVSILALALTQPGWQTAALATDAATSDAAGAWIYRGSDVPQDKEWVFGQLPNGVRYAVRKNGVPPGQVSIRIRMDVGALHESDSERGYAHLLEHLVFRQSRYLAEGAAIPIWQRLGATFGSDTNAETSHISTTYKLDLPNTNPQSLDESFKLLSGMMIAPTLSEANLRSEVPIVMAEKRERGGRAERVFEATQQTLFAGQRIAVRPVIGTAETLAAASQTSIRAFHSRWYRPENAVIVAVGDVEPALLQQLITRYFADWPTSGVGGVVPPFGDPLAPAGSKGPNPVGETGVIVEPELPRSLTYAVMRPWRPVRDTIAYNQGIMIDTLAQAIINRRLETRARAGGSYLLAQVDQQKVSRSADMTMVAITPLGEKWDMALADVRAEIASAMASPPTTDEIAREVAELNVAFESAVEQRQLLVGGKLADDLVTAVDINEAIASPETVLAVFNSSRPLFTPQAVLEHTRKLFTGTVTRAIYVTPKPGEVTKASLRAALQRPVVVAPGVRRDVQPIAFADLPALGQPGTVISDSPTGLLTVSEVQLANGVKALLWPSADEPGRLSVKVRWGRGYAAFAPQDAPYIQLGDMALVGSGQGSLGQEELDRIATGRKMGYNFSIEDSAFKLSADTRSADLADQLYLFAGKFATPRWDANPVIRAQAAARLQYESFFASPQGILQRDMKWLRRGRDPRFAVSTPAQIASTTPEGFKRVWAPILATGPIEVQIFGDFDRAKAVEALRNTFGALPARQDVSQIPPRFPAIPASENPIVLTHRGDPSQAAALIAWPTGGGMDQVAESRQLQILADLYQIRLLDAMREKLGAAYAPQVANEWPEDLASGGSLMAVAQIAPRDVPAFFATAEEIAADLAARPPSDDELARVIEPLRQQLTRASTSSAFFMYQLEGATRDPRKFAAIRTVLRDYTQTTPSAIQALAQKYLRPGASWRAKVVPQAKATSPASGASGKRQ